MIPVLAIDARGPKVKKMSVTKMEEEVAAGSPERPRTATLDRPSVLNVALIDIDMTKMRKAVLPTPDLFLPHNQRDGQKAFKCSGSKERKVNEDARRRIEAKQNEASQRPNKIVSQLKHHGRVSPFVGKFVGKSVHLVAKGRVLLKKENVRAQTNNNDKVPPRPVVVKKVAWERVGVALDREVMASIPDTRRTCDRLESERLHSHPAVTAMRSTPSPLPTPDALAKNSVQKPFQSDRGQRQAPGEAATIGEAASAVYDGPTRPHNTPALPCHAPVLSKDDAASQQQLAVAAKPRGPKFVMCYLCGREFGTTSYPLHEPHCLQRWQQENARLPPAMRREPPQKPDKQMSLEEWNAFAWEATKAQLVPCPRCGRKFNSDWVEVHARSCRGPAHTRTHGQLSGQVKGQPSGQANGKAEARSNTPTSGRASKAIICYLCGREYSTASFPLHEPHCLQRWQREKARLPSALQRKPPQKPYKQMSLEECNAFAREASQARPVPCPRCGRKFDSERVEMHSRSCGGPAHARIKGQPNGLVNGQPYGQANSQVHGKTNGQASGPANNQGNDSNNRQPKGITTATSRPKPNAASATTSTSPHLNSNKKAAGTTLPSPPPMRPPPTHECYICGRMFGTASIGIHEPQCLKKWRAQNERLPSAQRSPEPMRPAAGQSLSRSVPRQGTGRPTPARNQQPCSGIRASPSRAAPVHAIASKQATFTSTSSRTTAPSPSKSTASSPCRTVAPTPSKTAPQSPSKTAGPSCSKTRVPSPNKTTAPSTCRTVAPTPSKTAHPSPSKTADPSRSRTTAHSPSHRPSDGKISTTFSTSKPANTSQNSPTCPAPAAEKNPSPFLRYPRHGHSTGESPLSTVTENAPLPEPALYRSRTLPSRCSVRMPTFASTELSQSLSFIENSPHSAPPPIAAPAPTSEAPLLSAPSSSAARNTFRHLCYVCGSDFVSIASLSAHEDQCIRMWHQENQRMPPDCRQPEPQRPRISNKGSGVAGNKCTMEELWKNHLKQLVPCKSCKRTFYPERLKVHEKVCTRMSQDMDM